MWMGLIQSVKGLNRTKDWSTPVRENSACRWSLDLHCNIAFSLSPQLDGLGTGMAAAVYIHIYIYIHTYIYIYTHTHTHTHTHISPIDSVSLENPD